MPSKRFHLMLIISLLLSLSLACALTGESTEPPGVEEDLVATGVAETIAAVETESHPVPDNETETDPMPEPDIVFQGVSFAFDPSLAESVNAENIPGEGDENAFFSTPDHLSFTFNNYALVDAFHTPVIKIYSVEEFRAVNGTVGESLDTLKAVIDSQPVYDENIFVADMFGAAQYFRSLIGYLRFQNGTGVRFITQYGQDASPIGWPSLIYAFQGFTNDGQYYVSAIFPISHPSLPDPDEVVMDDAFYDNFLNYKADTQMLLDLQELDTFVPSALLLDGVIESTLVESQ
ncbi:MAG: hypothetical protein WBB69_00405 [Anaerolineales bacterium]